MKNKSRFQITFDVYPHVFRRLPENRGEKAKSIVRIHHKCLSLSKSSKIGCISEEQRKRFFSLVFLSIWINFSRSRMRIYLYSLRLIEILHYLCTHKQTTDQNMKQRLFLSLALSLCMASMLANGIYYVDHSYRVSTKNRALSIGREHNQISILKWNDMSLIYC